MPYQCSFGADHGAAVLVITYLETGDTVSPCGGCLPPMVATMAGAMGYTVTDAAATEPTQPAATPARGRPARKRAGKAAQNATAGQAGPAPAPDTGEEGGDGAAMGGDAAQSADPDAGDPGHSRADGTALGAGAAHRAMQEVTGGVA